jgi:hypothetical protein
MNLKHLLSISFLYLSGGMKNLLKHWVYILVTIKKSEKLNWENKIDKMNTLFFSWGKRNLTILGKVMIIKALVIPIFTNKSTYP